MKLEFNRQTLVFDAILQATPEQIIRIVREWTVSKHAFEGIPLRARQTGKYQDRVDIDYYQDNDVQDNDELGSDKNKEKYRNAGEVITHGSISSTHVTISFWDWENREFGDMWANWNGFATPPNAKVIFEDLSNTLRRKIPTLQDNLALKDTPKQSATSEAEVAPSVETTSKPEKPPLPNKGSSITTWLDYYHAMKNANQKISFRILANLSGYSANTFKQEHGKYKLERGIT